MITLSDALDLLPEAWHNDVADDAAGQGCTLGYTAAAGGLRTETIERVQRIFAEREDDADWLDMSLGQQLDECFPDYNGIGAFELLSELGVTPVYVLPVERPHGGGWPLREPALVVIHLYDARLCRTV